MNHQQKLKLHKVLSQQTTYQNWVIFCYDYCPTVYHQLSRLDNETVLWELLDWATLKQENEHSFLIELKRCNRTAYQTYMAEIEVVHEMKIHQTPQRASQNMESNMGSDLTTIKTILQQVEANLGDIEELRKTLAEIEAKRQEAIRRISQTQRRVLETIPESPILVDFVLINIRTQVGSLSQIRDKELYLRLHELRYLGLISRRLNEHGQWLYWRDSSTTK